MSTVAEPHVHRWTRHDYHAMNQLGLFAGKHVELIAGQVITMSPMGSRHATAVALVARALEATFGSGAFARWQMPFGIGDRSEPEPDVAIIVGNVRDYAAEHPTAAALLVEVADTSLAYDREIKGNLYASAGVADYWIINLVDEQVEVYRQPQPDPALPHSYHYAQQMIYRVGDTIAPLAQPAAAVAVADVLP